MSLIYISLIIQSLCYTLYPQYLFYSWKFVSFDPLHWFYLSPNPSYGNPPICSLLSMNLDTEFFFFFKIPHIRLYSICLSLSDLFHLACPQGPFMLLQMARCQSILELNNIPLYMCTTISLSIRPSVDPKVVSMSWLW